MIPHATLSDPQILKINKQVSKHKVPAHPPTTLMVSFLASLAALTAALGCFGIATGVSRGKSPVHLICAAILTLMTATGILSLRTWVAWLWIAPVIWICLLGGATYAISEARRWLVAAGKSRQGAQSSATLKILFYVSAGLIIIEILWAGLPLYRYDQWTSHLVVAKLIDLTGTLKPPVSYDPTFFTGTYEFIGLLPRALWSNDFFQQGFQNSFSLLFVTLSGIILVAGEEPPSRSRLGIAFAFALTLLFATGDHEALVNAKPDYILMTLTLMITISLCEREDPRPLAPTLLGAAMACGVAYKLTWLHFAAAAAPFCLFSFRKEQKIAGIKKLIFGALIALPLAAPFLIKNWMFFDNPLHPAQTPFWHSSIWGPEYVEYWQTVSAKPLNASQFVGNIPKIILGLPGRLWLALLVITAISGFTNFATSDNQREKPRFNYAKLVGILCLYVVLWGIFYGPTIYNRFLSPLFAFGATVIWSLIRRVKPSARIMLFLMLPFFLDGQIEVTLRHLGIAWSQTPMEFHDAFPKSPAANNKTLREIAAHRTAHHPGADYDRAALISDYPLNFYGPSNFFVSTDPVTFWNLRHEGIDPENGCAAAFFRKYDIRYLWLFHGVNRTNWPQSIIKLIPGMTPVPVSIGELWHVDNPDLLSCADHQP